jgi:DNA-binding CsgD family transcriptional regulator
MANKAITLRPSDRVWNYIKQYVTLAGPDKRDEVLSLFDGLHRLFPQWAVMTCPIMHPDIHYVSRNCQSIFGYQEDHMLNNIKPIQYFNLVHEADQHDLQKCFSFMHDYLEIISPDEHHSYRSVFHYRLRKDTGMYMHLHDEKASLKLERSGNLYYSLFRDVTEEQIFSGVKVEIFKEQNGLQKIKEFKPSADRMLLSKREGELVALVRQGLSNKEIAWYLKISPHTVRNIKSRLFEKYNVNNTVALLNMTA